ncbi:MAG: low molecular weight protein-tyrosine-phosphatase, partial [Candidatus Competibacterales bacterium]|nr:low molecular weight protein-tyrosine-phosphatase [Candidatus Competibacterales bacterium]
MTHKPDVQVLFVCMGNICRSPTAHGVFRHLVEQANLAHRIGVDSAGTHDFHIGHPPDRRARAAAAERGYELADLRARAVVPDDLFTFDHILAMDRSNHRALLAMVRSGEGAKVELLLDYAELYRGEEVPDPYYGGPAGFDNVLDRVEAG